jgi:hypothetical protein
LFGLTHDQRLLQKFKIFTAFYHLSELKDREDLVKGIIENLDYSMFVLGPFFLLYLLTVVQRWAFTHRLV